MEINNWFDLVIYAIFTFGVLFIGLIGAVYELYQAIKAWRIFGCCSYMSNNFMRLNNLEDIGVKSPLGLLLFSLIIILISIWYLFIDKGGQLFNCLNEVKRFFS